MGEADGEVDKGNVRASFPTRMLHTATKEAKDSEMVLLVGAVVVEVEDVVEDEEEATTAT